MKWQDLLVEILRVALVRALPLILAALGGATVDALMLGGAVGHAALRVVGAQ